jgi:type IV secretion system protein VirB6
VVFTAALLASLEPSLQGLAVARADNRYAIEPVLTVLVIVLTFTAVFGSVIGLCTRLVAGFRLPDAKQREPDPVIVNSDSVGRQTGFEAEQANSDNRVARLAAMVGQRGDGQTSVGQGGTDRRDARLAASVMGAAASGLGGGNTSTTTLDRRTDVTSGGLVGGERSQSDVSGRLGQSGRKRSNPTRARASRDSQASTFVAKRSALANGSKA